MGHSYEEIRAAAFDVLSGRIRTVYGVNQYRHFAIGVASALMEKSGHAGHSMSGSEATLGHEDADKFLELFWNLFREGVITLGFNDANPEFPWFRLTQMGSRMVNQADGYFVHDVSGYEKRILTEIPKLDPITLLYLKEALQAFQSGCLLSSTVMLGVATEHTFLLLMESVDKNKVHQATFSPVSKERTILQKVNKFKNILDQHLKTLPSPIKEDLDTNFLGILSIIRNYRNQSGHPSGKIIDREQVYVLLQLFPHYCKKMYQMRSHFG